MVPCLRKGAQYITSLIKHKVQHTSGDVLRRVLTTTVNNSQLWIKHFTILVFLIHLEDALISAVVVP